MIGAIGFDLGETLIHNDGVPLSWSSMYRDALVGVGGACGVVADEAMLAGAEAVLSKYNTRLNPRVREVSSDVILGEVLACWGTSSEDYLATATAAFFSFFRQNVSVYDDVLPTLVELKRMGLRVGVLTDVPYGMGRAYVERDVASFAECLDAVLTSVDVGCRKPHPSGFLQMAGRLGVEPGRMIYVGNEPKDVAGARSAGMKSVLIDRDGSLAGCGEDWRVGSLVELAGLIV